MIVRIQKQGVINSVECDTIAFQDGELHLGRVEDIKDITFEYTYFHSDIVISIQESDLFTVS